MATGCRLHVIHPIGFQMDEKARRRAGLDYWELVDCVEHETWDAYLRDAMPKRVWLYTTTATRAHWDAPFKRGDHMIFGQENGGVPKWLHDWVDSTHGADHRLTFPMRPIPQARSLNLATAAACAVYEGMRQVSDSAPLW